MEEMELKTLINIKVNGKEYELAVEPTTLLVDLLRSDLELTGTKKGCGSGECGSCTVILNGKPVNSCLVLAMQANGADVLTIEGLKPAQGLHRLQQAFVEKGAIQCGFCTPGMILSANSLLQKKTHPTEVEIREALSGNLCRCTGYQKIVEAVQSVGESEEQG
jgi:aerobic carbon-monoxide dehydrogenase small subunit